MATRFRRLAYRLRRELIRLLWALRPGPLLSVVVPVYDVEKYLDECLTSLRHQYYRHLEIVVVDDGSLDNSLAIAQRHAAKDKRIHLVRQENGGLSAARNAGVRAASGAFLTFVDSDDMVLPAGYAHAMTTLKRTGSDFAILPYERFKGRAVPTTPAWISTLYTRALERVTIATRPELLVHATAWSKVYRREFWDRAGLEFEPGALYEDQAVTARAHVAATAVDVVPTLNYRWRIRAQSITREFSARTMTAFFDAIEESLNVLDAVPGARAARLIQVLGNDLPHYIRAIPRVADESFVAVLFERLPELLRQVDPLLLIPATPVHVRVAYRLIELQAKERLYAFINHDGFKLNMHDGILLPEGPALRLPEWGAADLAPATFVLSERQTPLETKVLRARWVSDTTLELTIWGYLRHVDDPDSDPSARAWLVAGDNRVLVPVQPSPERPSIRGGGFHASYDRSVWTVRLEADTLAADLPARTTSLSLELEVDYAGRSARMIVSEVDPESSAAAAQPHRIGKRTWALRADGGFHLALSKVAPAQIARDAYVDDVVMDESGVVLRGRWANAPAGPVTAVLVSHRLSVTGSVQSDGTAFTVSFPLEAGLWGQQARPLPLGTYAVELTRDGVAMTVGAGAQLLARTPVRFSVERQVADVIRTAGDGIALRMVKPRVDRAQTVYGQRQLRREYRALEVEVDANMALFQCYWAEVATDSPRAIHAEMRRRNPSMKLYWGVVDHSVELPEGAIGVIAGSPEWYQVLARAKYLVKNTELGAYTRLRPGQIHVQTFHGQPFKTMGASLWRDVKGWPQFRVDYECTERRSDFWSFILTASSDSNRFYRENYGYDGPILDRGLPRNDSLVGAQARANRDRTRKVLGIGDDQIAVLNALTWRDDQSTGRHGARDVDYVDLVALRRALGSDYVLLQRGHGAVARTDNRRNAADGIIDVTDYPEVNDLMLASDVAILDYSSLRFDYAITGKPMVFLVPDLDRYGEQVRGFLFDYEGTAPGPLVRDAAELPALLADLPALKARYRSDYEAFNLRFNRCHDGMAARRVVDALFAGSGDANAGS